MFCECELVAVHLIVWLPYEELLVGFIIEANEFFLI